MEQNLECGFEMFPVLWTIDPLDWKTENADQIVEKVMSEAKKMPLSCCMTAMNFGGSGTSDRGFVKGAGLYICNRR